MMRRSREAGVIAQIITGGSLQESKEALQLCVSGEHRLIMFAAGLWTNQLTSTLLLYFEQMT